MSRDLPLVRRLRRLLAGGSGRTQPRWSEHRTMFDQSVMIVGAYYVFAMYVLYSSASGVSRLSGSLEGMDLLWPVFWFRWTGVELGGDILAHLCLAAGLLGAVAWRYLPVRALVSVALLMKAAQANSYGAMSHGLHEMFWVSVCFLFLPNARPAELVRHRAGRMQFLLAFSAAPALILMFYTLSGMYKVWFATLALVYGEFGGFHPYAMAHTLAWRSIQVESDPMWAGLVLNAPLLGWPLYVGLYFVELVAIAVFFRPALHRTWGVILIGFHFGTLLFMDIPFVYHVLINGLLFVMSPFAPKNAGWRETAAAVPLFGVLFRRSPRAGDGRTKALSARSGGG